MRRTFDVPTSPFDDLARAEGAPVASKSSHSSSVREYIRSFHEARTSTRILSLPIRSTTTSTPSRRVPGGAGLLPTRQAPSGDRLGSNSTRTARGRGGRRPTKLRCSGPGTAASTEALSRPTRRRLPRASRADASSAWNLVGLCAALSAKRSQAPRPNPRPRPRRRRAPRGRPSAGCRRCRSGACGACPLSASRAACACASRRRRSTWP